MPTLASILQDHLEQCPSYSIIATDAAQCEEKADVGIYSLQPHSPFSLWLPPVVVQLAWPSESCVLSSVPLLLSPMSFHSVQPWLLQTDQICILFFLVPCHIHLIRLLWVPSTASHINERGDFFESSSLSRPVLHFFLVFPFAQVPVSSSFYSWSTPSHHCSRQMTYLKFRWIWVNAFPVSVRWLWPVFSAGFLP